MAITAGSLGGSCPFPWRDEWTRKSCWTQESIEREHFPIIGWVTATGKTFTSSSMKELLGRCALCFYLLLLFAFFLFFQSGKVERDFFCFFLFIALSRYWDESIVFPTTRGFLQKIDFPRSTNNFHSISQRDGKKNDLFVEKKPVYKEADKLETETEKKCVRWGAFFPI